MSFVLLHLIPHTPPKVIVKRLTPLKIIKYSIVTDVTKFLENKDDGRIPTSSQQKCA